MTERSSILTEDAIGEALIELRRREGRLKPEISEEKTFTLEFVPLVDAPRDVRGLIRCHTKDRVSGAPLLILNKLCAVCKPAQCHCFGPRGSQPTHFAVFPKGFI